MKFRNEWKLLNLLKSKSFINNSEKMRNKIFLNEDDYSLKVVVDIVSWTQNELKYCRVWCSMNGMHSIANWPFVCAFTW